MNMKTVWLGLLVVMLLPQVDEMGNRAQAQGSDRSADRMVGAAEVYYLRDKNKTRSQVRIYLQGTPDDTKAQKDTVSMDVICEVDGQKVTKPRYASIAITVYSAHKSKYSKDHNLHIFTQGLEGGNGAEWRTRLVSTQLLPAGGSLEIFLSPALEYARILRMANATAAVVTFGESSFPLKQKDLQALKDLNQAIEK